MSSQNSGKNEEGSTLRERAEASISSHLPVSLEALQVNDIQRLLHELQVHEAELEMQNEELREAQIELAKSHDRFADLYDSAPVGYLTLRSDLTIIRTNRRAAELMGFKPRDLLGKSLSHFVLHESQSTLYLHQQALLKTHAQETCELLLSTKGKGTVTVLMKTAYVRDTAMGDPCLRCVLLDLSELKTSEAALRESELRLSSLIDSIPDTVQFKDPEGRWLIANPPALRTFGIKDISWEGCTDLELAKRLPEKSQQLKACAQSDAEVLRRGMPVCVEETLSGIDGTTRSFEVIKVPLKSADCRCNGLVVVGRDISMRKKAENEVRHLNDTLKEQVAEQTLALRLSEERFRLIYEHAPTGIAVIDAGGRIVQCNPIYSEITGYSEEELRKKPYGSIIHPQDQKQYHDLIQRLSKSKKAESFEITNRNVHKDGHSVWVHKVISKFPDNSHFIILGNDISSRRKAEERLQRSEQTLTSFFESAPIGLIGLGPDGRILRVNHSQLEMLELPEKAMLGRNIVEFDSGEDLAGILAALNQGEVISDRRAQLRQSSGARAHVLIDAIAIKDGGQVLRMDLFIRNITRRIELERQMLEVSERERQQVGRELHDDLGQILHGIHFIASELLARMEASGQAEAKSLAHITENLDLAMVTTRDLARGLQPVPPVPEGLVSALRELLGRMKKLYGVHCRFICPNPIEVNDREVATHLFRIAQEAMTNAIKHSKCTQITVQLKRANGDLVLTIRDNGTGRRKRSKSSHGIGLHIMQSRASAIGGTLIIQNGSNRGAEVVCRLPQEGGCNCKT